MVSYQLILLSVASLSLAWSPTDSYAPGPIECPSDLTLVRPALNISKDEADYIEQRNKITDAELKTFLDNADMKDFDADQFLSSLNTSIKIGLTFSGGGYRAMLNGAGQLAALDNRTPNSTVSGLGGLLQASSYLVGLSGGNWLVGTLAMNNWTSVQEILDEGIIWNMKHSLANYGGANVIKTYDFYSGISDDLDDKRDAGFDVSFTDTWGRALSHQFFTKLNDTGAALTWSTMPDSAPFQNHSMPFPIVVTDGRTPGTYIISGNSTVFEVNPYELGSWDPSVYQFAKVKYLGTELQNGTAKENKCIGGFDNAGFIMGTSSSLFNQFILQINTTSLAKTIQTIITSILSKVSDAENDVAVYKPNPFANTSDYASSKSIVSNDTLFLVDGGEDLQNIPFYPLIQRQRKLDVIFAYDNSADTDQSWPNGTAVVATYERQFLPQANNTIFPYVPDVETFRNLNLTARPVFFGCDAKNLTSLMKKNSSSYTVYDSPLIVYTANRPFTYWSNTSTFKMSYEENEKRSVIENGYAVATRLNNTLDPEWKACVGCAIIRRQQERAGIEQSDQCKQCFARYCWNGDLDTSSDVNINFTTTGTTNDTETSPKPNSSSTLATANAMKMLGYALLSVCVFTLV
jgi:lysophospholipase